MRSGAVDAEVNRAWSCNKYSDLRRYPTAARQ